jgi:hypothetical protein
VRKEVAALRKMVERSATGYQVVEFYEEHLNFVSEVLHLDPASAVPLRQAFFDRAWAIERGLAAGEPAKVHEFIDRLAATEPQRLATLITGGTK